jgi:hypothetical protein
LFFTSGTGSHSTRVKCVPSSLANVVTIGVFHRDFVEGRITGIDYRAIKDISIRDDEAESDAILVKVPPYGEGIQSGGEGEKVRLGGNEMIGCIGQAVMILIQHCFGCGME